MHPAEPLILAPLRNARRPAAPTSAGPARLVALALAVLLTLAAPRARAADPFFAHRPPRAAGPMFFSMYSVLPQQNGNANLARLAAGRFTAAGPYYNADGKPTGDGAPFYARVDEVRTAGLGYVAHVAKHPAVVDDVAGETRPWSMAAIDEASLRAHVRQVADYTLHNAAANGAVTAWYILPEELRPWKLAEMNYLRVVADELHRYDPLRRPVTMYNPNHRTAAELTTVVSQGLDWTLMGVYAADVPFAQRAARLADGFDRILAAAQATDARPVAAFELWRDFPAVELDALSAALGGVGRPAAIRHVIRHDVYQGLIRGIEGVQVWSGCDCRPNLTTFTHQLDAYASVANTLNGDLALARVLLGGERRTDLRVETVAGPAAVSFQSTTIDSVAWADIAYGDARYLLLVNGAAAPVAARVSGLPAGEPRITSLLDGAALPEVDRSTGVMTLALDPLAVVALRIDGVADADATGDRRVTGADFTVWQRNLGLAAAGGPSQGDFNYDGRVDARDLAAWRSQVRAAGATATHAAVPEPLSAALLAIAAICTHRARRRATPQAH